MGVHLLLLCVYSCFCASRGFILAARPGGIKGKGTPAGRPGSGFPPVCSVLLLLFFLSPEVGLVEVDPEGCGQRWALGWKTESWSW